MACKDCKEKEKSLYSVPRPVYELGTTVFAVDTLTKANIYERVYVEGIGKTYRWLYRLQVGITPEGQPMITQNLVSEDTFCLKLEAEEILKKKEEEIANS